MRMVIRNGGVPWWLIVGLIGFLVFGGWRGFFGAIAGVILIPIALVILFALGFFVYSWYLMRKGRTLKGDPFKENLYRSETLKPQGHRPNDIVTEATVIKTEDP